MTIWYLPVYKDQDGLVTYEKPSPHKQLFDKMAMRFSLELLYLFKIKWKK